MPLIVEGVMTTLNEDGEVNISPMGPIVDQSFSRFEMRPFQTSRTYANLKRSGAGVFHVTDDVELIARAAINRLSVAPEHEPAVNVVGRVLTDCCRWYELEVVTLDDAQERTRITCSVRHFGTRREFFGFNRGKHAVLEAAILATRIHLLEGEFIAAEFERLETIVDKTGGEVERRAFALLQDYVGEPK